MCLVEGNKEIRKRYRLDMQQQPTRRDKTQQGKKKQHDKKKGERREKKRQKKNKGDESDVDFIGLSRWADHQPHLVTFPAEASAPLRSCCS